MSASPSPSAPPRILKATPSPAVRLQRLRASLALLHGQSRLTSYQLAVMVDLLRPEPDHQCLAKDIAKDTGLISSTVWTALNSLNALGFITLTDPPVIPAGRTPRIAALTPSGIAYLRALANTSTPS